MVEESFNLLVGRKLLALMCGTFPYPTAQSTRLSLARSNHGRLESPVDLSSKHHYVGFQHQSTYSNLYRRSPRGYLHLWLVTVCSSSMPGNIASKV